MMIISKSGAESTSRFAPRSMATPWDTSSSRSAPRELIYLRLTSTSCSASAVRLLSALEILS